MRFFQKTPLDTTDYTKLSFNELIQVVRVDWTTINNDSAAASILDALIELKNIEDTYISDGGCRLVSEFLAHSRKWHSYRAKLVKSELMRRLAASINDYD
jgi:hypothetical protein